MARVKRARSTGVDQAPGKRSKSNKEKKETGRERGASDHNITAPKERGRPRKAAKASSTSKEISLPNPANTTAVPEPQQRKSAEQNRQKREDLMLFLDLGNSQTQAAYCWKGKQLSWFDDWAGELKTTQVPTVVTAYRKANREWTRSFGVHARMDSHQIEGAIVFDRLKMNFDPDSKYLKDQKEKEDQTGYRDNWDFLLESYLTTVLDGIVDPRHPPKSVYVYMGPPAKWDAAVIARYTASVVPPAKWAGKFEMVVRVLNEASAAFLGRVNNGLKLKTGQRGIVIDPGHGTTEFTTVRKDLYSHAIEHYTGINHGGLQIDDFARDTVAEAYRDRKPSTRKLAEWIDGQFQARYKRNMTNDENWFFDGETLPEATKKAITKFAIHFYKDLASKVSDYVKQQLRNGKVQTIVLTGGGAAATAFQNEMRHHDGNWDFSPQQQNDVIWGLYYHSRNPSHLSYDNWPLTMGIRTDDENIKNLDELEKKAESAIFFTEKGTKVPASLKPMVWDLTRQKNDKFKFDVSLVLTNEDLSNVPYLKDVSYKETTAQGCAELALEPVVLDIQSRREATIYVFPIPEGDMLALTIICRRDGQESTILNRLGLYRKQNFRLDGFEGAEYIRREVRFATGKECSEVE